MSQFISTRTINAPVEQVFKTVSDIRNFSKAVPDIVDIEMLSEISTGVGTRFRETRNMNGRKASTELEVTEYEENSRIRLVSDTHGTIWNSEFTVRDKDGRSELQLVMDARAYKMMSKMMNPFFKKIIQKALEKDMDAVKIYCEQ